MRTKVALALAAAALCCLALGGFAARCPAQPPDPRVGFAEEFNSVDGWKFDEKNPLEGMKAVNGVAVFDTYVGTFQYPTKPPEQPVAVRATTAVSKEYDQEVDLDKYHYIVMKIDEKSMYSNLELNDKPVQVAYTTGIMAQDLKPLGFTGKQKIRLSLDIMNNNRELKADYIRLVSSLTDEEKAALVRPPVRIYKENVEGHLFEHLNALNARAARTWRDGAEEKVVFRNVGTDAVIWRMTANPSDEGFSEEFQLWMPDGSAWCGRQGYVRTYVFATDKFLDGKIDQLDPPKYVVSTFDRQNPDEIKVFRRNAKTGEQEVIHKTSKAGNLGLRSDICGDKIAVLVAGVKLAVIHGAEEDPAKRIREYPVPKGLSCKGGTLTSDGKYFEYYAPFGCYRQVMVDTDTGALAEGSLFTFTHGMSGRPWSLMSYGTNAKLQVAEGAAYGGNSKPGDLLKVYGVYLDPVATDYGGMTDDGRYGYTNGTGGELAGQHLMFDRFDPGTILRLCTYRVSMIDWHVWTKTVPSPDYTKLMYVSDMLGDSDYFMGIVRLPDPPREPKVEKLADGGVRLSWQAPEHHAEILGYNVYRSAASGQGYQRINDKLITATELVDAPKGPAHYLVAAQERSGLEGGFSPEVAVDADSAPVCLHFEAEAGEAALPMRQIFDGNAAGYRGMRITQVADGEDAGALTIGTNVPRDGEYWVWARCRNRAAGKGAFTLSPAEAAEIAVDSKEWQWVRGTKKVKLAPGAKTSSLRLASAGDGLAVDKIIVTSDDGYKPADADDRTAAPPPVKGLKVAAVTSNSVDLEWQPADDIAHQYYTVYVGDKPDFAPSNETVLVSGYKTTASDWDIKPNTTYYYKVFAVDRRGKRSEAAAIEAKTQPLDVFMFEQAAGDAKHGEGVQAGKDEDVAYAAGPAQGAGDVTFEFTSPADGTYYVWAEYGARFGRPVAIAVALDDKSGKWPSREPGRMGRDLADGKARWFVDRVPVAGQYAVPLAKGKHQLKITLETKSAFLSKVWVTNDPSFVPPGFSAQLRFNRDRRQK